MASSKTCSIPGQYTFDLARPHGLSTRAQWLRDYYFKGNNRAWNNQFSPFTTGTPWDRVWNEGDYYIVPEMYAYMGENDKGPFPKSFELMAEPVPLPDGFWQLSIPERRAWFFREVMVNRIPQEIISDNDLIAGGRFNTQLSKCLDKKEQAAFEKENMKNRKAILRFHFDGFGNAGATGGHLIPDYKLVVEKGFKHLHEKAKRAYDALPEAEKRGPKGAELRAMIVSAEVPRDLAGKYAAECRRLSSELKSGQRKAELEQMAANLDRVPWEPARTFWEGVQAVWLAHMLVIAEESYPGPGTSFGRLDQYLWPLYEQDVIINKTITREFAKDIFSAFMFHCNTAYDAQITIGNQGITSGFGQLVTLAGIGPDGEDATNDLTYLILEVFDEWAPILEPKPNVRLHKKSPEKLLDVLVTMISRAQGAPFIINFDERSMAGLVTEGVPASDVWNYACVGCLENTMQGNDRSGTVNCNPNLARSIELTLWRGKSIPGFRHHKRTKAQLGPDTGDPATFTSWEEFFSAFLKQLKHIIKRTVDVYNMTEAFRSRWMPTPYVSILVDGMIESGRDIREAPPRYGFVTIEGVGFATTVDSLLAIKKFVYDEKKYTIDQVKAALQANYQGHKEYAIMQALFKNKAPKYGNDDKDADAIAMTVMRAWAEETMKYKTPTGYKFRPGMLSWNYWAGNDAALTPATPDGRTAGSFLSNAICPTNGADVAGPTAVANSVGAALGGKDGAGNHVNVLPNGASHTITFNPAILRDPEHKEKFKSYLRGYIENGGSALQINMLDSAMLKDAQLHPQNYGNLLVRVTGYNAYFTAIGKELQDEIIARESHVF
ncbi:MAG: pyruvate formate lyase family protein [Candidatus Sigynarchaeota archaeon]